MQGQWIGCFALGMLLQSTLTRSLQLRVGGFMHTLEHLDLTRAVIQDEIVDIARQHHLFYLRGVVPSRAARQLQDQARSRLYSCHLFLTKRSVVFAIVFYRKDVIRLRLPYSGPLEQSGLISPVAKFCVDLLLGFQMSFAVLGVNLQAVRSEADSLLELADQVVELEQDPDFPLVVIGKSVRLATNFYRDDYRVLEYVSSDPRYLQKSHIAVRGSMQQTVTQTEPVQLGDWYSGMDLPIGFTLDVYNLKVATKQQLRIHTTAHPEPNKNQQQRVSRFSSPAQRQSSAIATTSNLPGYPHIEGAGNQWNHQDSRYQPLSPQWPRKRLAPRRPHKRHVSPTKQQPDSSQKKTPFSLHEPHISQQPPSNPAQSNRSHQLSPFNPTQPHVNQQQPPFNQPQPHSSRQQPSFNKSEPWSSQEQPLVNQPAILINEQQSLSNQHELQRSQQQARFNQLQQYEKAIRMLEDPIFEGELDLQQAMADERQQGGKARQQPESDVEPDSRFRGIRTAIPTYSSPRTLSTDMLWNPNNKQTSRRPENQATKPQNQPQLYIGQQHSPMLPQHQNKTAASVIYEQILQGEMELQQALDVVRQRERLIRRQHRPDLNIGGGSINQGTVQPQPHFDLSPLSLHEPQHQRKPQLLFDSSPPSLHEPQQQQRDQYPLFDLTPLSFYESHQREPQPLYDISTPSSDELQRHDRELQPLFSQPQPYPYHAQPNQQQSDTQLWNTWEEVPASYLHAPTTEMVDQQLLQGERELQKALDKVIRQHSEEQWISRGRQQDAHDLELLDDILNEETVSKPST